MPPEWRQIQRNNFTQWNDFLEFIQLNLSNEVWTTPRFPLNIPLRLAQKIRKQDPCDPILRQFLPTTKEQITSSLFVLDPVGDTLSRKGPKLLHKYEGRALLVCTSACAMNCRYCFRQHFDYANQDPSFDAELKMIGDDTSLLEIILSGGDPLSLSNRILSDLIVQLGKIPHLKRLRFHSRFPIGIPERIDDEFLEILKSSRLQIYFVIHANHANELDEEIFSSLKKIQQLGIPVLSQSVLLKGINDSLEALENLCKAISDQGIIPYYLHQLDRVEGAAHFDVPVEKGRRLILELTKKLSGYAVPRYVCEEAGEKSKTILHSI